MRNDDLASCLWAHDVWGTISRNLLEIETCVQWTTNRKWPIGIRMVTWLSRDPEKSRSWPQYIWGPLSRQRLETRTLCQWSTYTKFLLFLMCNCAVNWCDKLRFLHLYSNNSGTVYGLSTINFAIDVRWTTGQLHFLAIVQARRFSLFGHIARMPDKTDVKKILTAVPLENWRRSPIYPSYYMDEDYPARPEIQKPFRERSNRHGWRVMFTFGAMHS